jgi:DNA replication initiation complex subunit (GINS family)
MINYNEIYEVLRKEKYSETLQPLSKGFLVEIAEFLSEKRNESLQEDNLFSDNLAKSKKQLENAISLFKELMRVRKRKLLNLVFVATETGIMKRDYENMLAAERDLFDRLVKSFEESDREITKVVNGRRDKEKEDKFRMVMFSQSVDQFMGMDGQPLGPYVAGELVNMDGKVAEIFVSGGKASFVDDE